MAVESHFVGGIESPEVLWKGRGPGEVMLGRDHLLTKGRWVLPV